MPVFTRAVVTASMHAELTAVTEQRAATGTRLQEVAEELEALQGMSEALWAQLFVGVVPEGLLAERLRAARGWVDDLIVEALYQGAHTTFTSVATHYNDVDFATVGTGYARNRTFEELMQLGEMVTPGTQQLVEQISSAMI